MLKYYIVNCAILEQAFGRLSKSLRVSWCALVTPAVCHRSLYLDFLIPFILMKTDFSEKAESRIYKTGLRIGRNIKAENPNDKKLQANLYRLYSQSTLTF